MAFDIKELNLAKEAADKAADQFAFNLYNTEQGIYGDQASPISIEEFNKRCHEYITKNVKAELTGDNKKVYEAYIASTYLLGACSKGFATYHSYYNTDYEDEDAPKEPNPNDKTEGQKDNGENKGGANSPDNVSNSAGNITKTTANVKLHELRTTPGFTNYVTSVDKNIAGGVNSAYLKRYYSTIDCELYFNGHWLEDVSEIQWTINQQTLPLWGYNSHLFDEVAQGTRIISGNFTVLFTEPQPLYRYTDANGDRTQSAGGTIKPASYEETVEQLKSQTVILNPNTGAKMLSNGEHAPVWAKNFDLDIVCGENNANYGNAVHIILKNCYIINSSSFRSKDGDVAGERYQFIARDYKTIQ